MEGDASRRSFYLEIFAVSFAGLLLEISYTRLISFKLFYYHTYLIIGLALLGIGSGGILVAVLPGLRTIALARLLARTAVAGAAATAGGYVVIALTPLSVLDLWSSPLEPVKLVVLCGALFASFLAIGVMIAALFARRPAAIGTLYFADLLGGGLGCAVAVPAMQALTPPGCIFLAGLVLALVGIRLAVRDERTVAALGGALTFVCAAGVVAPGILPDPVPDRVKSIHPSRVPPEDVLFSAWSAVFRVDVTLPLIRDAPARVIHHDGLWGSTLHRFDGDVASLGRFEHDERAYAFRTTEPAPERVLIIGAAGGHEILSALYFDAAAITAVELNPVTVGLLTGEFADYTGHLARHPRVALVNDEGRSFLARERTAYDLVFFVAPDSYAAMNAATAGAFVLSESYLYTVEMIVEALRHLRPGGIVCVQFGEEDYAAKPNRTARYVGTARAALARLGVDDPAAHVLVATTRDLHDVATILLKATPFTEDEIARFLETTEQIPGSVARHVPGRRLDAGPVATVLTIPAPALADWYAAHPYDLRPVVDDAPFFWHFARFRTVLGGLGTRLERGAGASREIAGGERVLLLLLAVAALFAATFLLLPLVAIRRLWTALPHKGAAGLYFAALGLGFMLYEICLIQKLTLLLGYPTYSLSVTLMSLLVFTGCGSLATAAYGHRRDRALVALLGLLIALTLFYRVGLDWLTAIALPAPLAVRVAVAIAVLLPLGLVLGAFMPLGLATVERLGAHGGAYVAWAWAVNGFFSVIGSVLTTMLAMAFGFRAVLLLGLAAYTLAAVVLHRLPGGAARP